MYRQFSSDDPQAWELKQPGRFKKWIVKHSAPIILLFGIVAAVFHYLF